MCSVLPALKSEVQTDERDVEGDEWLHLEGGEPAVGRENEEPGDSEDIGGRLSAKKVSEVISNFSKLKAESFMMHLFPFSIIKQQNFHLK